MHNPSRSVIMRRGMTAIEVIKRLCLVPLEPEGGYFVETYRGSMQILTEGGGRRAVGTAIYYLLTDVTVSRLHRLTSDELWHFYLGDPVEMIQLTEGGRGKV